MKHKKTHYYTENKTTPPGDSLQVASTTAHAIAVPPSAPQEPGDFWTLCWVRDLAFNDKTSKMRDEVEGNATANVSADTIRDR